MPQTAKVRPASITDPADLWNLIGRFFLAQVLNFLLLMNLINRNTTAVIVLAVASLVVHRMVIVLWKRLTKERLDKLAAQETAP